MLIKSNSHENIFYEGSSYVHFLNSLCYLHVPHSMPCDFWIAFSGHLKAIQTEHGIRF
jgi:hypothetical protein